MKEEKSMNKKILKLLTSQPFVLFVFIVVVSVATNSVNDKFLTTSTITQTSHINFSYAP